MRKSIILVATLTLLVCQLVLAVRNNTTLELSGVINKTITQFYDDGEDDSDEAEDVSTYEVEEIYEEIILDDGSSDSSDDSSSEAIVTPPCIVINDNEVPIIPIVPATPVVPTVELNVGNDIDPVPPVVSPEIQIPEIPVPQEPVLNLFDSDKTMFVTASSLNVRSEPTLETSDNIITQVPFNQEIQVLGEVPGTDFVFTGSVEDPVFLSQTFLSEEKQTDWSGNRLTKTNGTVIGPSGKETYYNLNMKQCVATMRERGNFDPYWVRHDGAKMLGNYVMVAADLNKHPRGSLVPTSLGVGIVVDTGAFVHNGSGVNLDICTAW